MSLLQKRTVFIPIAWVSHNEQLLNARQAAKVAPAVILTESELTPESLLTAIEKVEYLKPKTKVKADPFAATDKMLTVIHGYLQS